MSDHSETKEPLTQASRRGDPTNNGGGMPILLDEADIPRVRAAIEAAGGVMTSAANVLGVSRATLYRFRDRFPEVKEAQADATDKLLDLAEAKIINAVNAGDMRTVRWILDRKGKDRGYGNVTELTGKGGAPLVPQAQRPTLDVSKLSTDALKEIRAASIDAAEAEGE